MKTKKTIKLDQVQLGQILALDVSDLHGNCLIAKGIELCEKTISSLSQRGIDSVVVWGHALNENEILAQQNAIKAQLAQRFRKVQNNTEMCLLHDILLSWRLESYESGTGDD